MDFTNELTNLIKANISSLYIQSYEWQRFQAKIRKVAKEQNKKLFYFNDVKGLGEFNFDEKQFKYDESTETDIIEVLEKFEENSIYVFEEIHSYLNDERVVNRFKFTIRELKRKKSNLIFFSTVLTIPKELEKELMILDMPLPTLSDFERSFNHLAKEFGISTNIDINILKSLLGLTIEEATNAISKAIAQNEKLTDDEIAILISQKEQIIKKEKPHFFFCQWGRYEQFRFSIQKTV